MTPPAKMTADELVFFVNGKKVSRGCLSVWSSCCLGRVSSLLPGPSDLIWSRFLSLYCCSLVTLEQEEHRLDTQRAKEGGKGRREGCPFCGSRHTGSEVGKEQSLGKARSHQHLSISVFK